MIMAGFAHSGKSRVTVPLPYYVNFLVLMFYLYRTNTFNYVILFFFLLFIYVFIKRLYSIRAVLSKVIDIPR